VRFVSFSKNGRVGLAIREPTGLTGMLGTDDERLMGGLAGLLAGGHSALLDAHDLIAQRGVPMDNSNIYILPPVPRPSKIICVGLNYRDHSSETGFEQPSYPTIFARYASSLIGAGAPLLRPWGCTQFDYEGEIAAVIGVGGRHIPRDGALKHVAGYALFNDASARDYQFKTPQWTMGKNFDSTGAFGPEFVSVDELPDGCNGLKIETRLNGVTVQSASTTDMVFDVPTLIEVISTVMTLEPGDVIVTGTPAGVGMARTPPLFMQAGDRVEVEVEGIGVLANPIVDADVQPIRACAQ
jgi:acylpyruvate hydrolase